MANGLSYEEAWKLLNEAQNELYGSGAVYRTSKIIDTEFAGNADAFLESYYVRVPKDAQGKSFTYMLKSEYNNVNNLVGNTSNVGSAVNSNTVGSTAGGGSSSGNVLLDVTKDASGKTQVSTGVRSLKTGLRSAGNFVMKEVLPAVAAAGVGIKLGKTIDKTLYDINPDFWESKGMSSLNPDTWNSITTGDNSALAGAFNMIFGLDPNTGNAQAYIDQDAFAYLVGYMQSKNIFDSEAILDVSEVPETTDTRVFKPLTNLPVYKSKSYRFAWTNVPGVNRWDVEYNFVGDGTFYHIYSIPDGTIYSCSDKPFKVTYVSTGLYKPTYPPLGDSSGTQINGRTYYGTRWNVTTNPDSASINPFEVYYGGFADTKPNWQFNYTGAVWGYYFFNGKEIEPTVIDGLENQDGSTQYDPTGTTASDTQSIIDALKKQYPDLFENAIVNSTVDPNTGEQTDRIYLPIGIPNGVTDPTTDTQPTTDDNAQDNKQDGTGVNPGSDPTEETKTLLNWLIPFLTPQKTLNPTNTGTGETPSVVVPTGTASALWTVYNPSQGQINQFGAWLWSSDFVDQLKKLFNDPMSAIIGLHKVFCTPATGGTQNIKVGYLDSGVPSAVVTSQYATINCGSVNLPEYFGNVLDYNPNTRVQCYLPFIGIVPLDVGEIMRSTLTVVYHVDVLTGACLAEIRVMRDGNNANLYTYSGNASVQYPLSSGSYMGIVSSALSVAGSIGSAILSGGATAPLVAGSVMAGIGNAKTNIQHSGSLSGNAGAMGGKIPYLIISRPQAYIADNYKHFVGMPENKYVTLSQCNGFTKVSAVHVENIPNATDAEKQEIETLLKQGVIL